MSDCNGVQVPFGCSNASKAGRHFVEALAQRCQQARFTRLEKRSDGRQCQLRPLDVGPCGGQVGVAAFISLAGELELERVLEDLVGAQRQVVRRHQHLRELLYEPVDGLVERIGHGHELVVGLAVPEAVLEAEEALEVWVVHPADEAEGTAIDLVVEVPERVIGGAQASVVEVGRQPQLACLWPGCRRRPRPSARRWPPRDAPIQVCEARPVSERGQLDLV